MRTKEQRKKYYLNNKEKIKQKAKEWRLNNLERVKEYHRNYAKIHSKEITEKSIKWRKNNYERYKMARRKRENDPIFFLSGKRIYRILKRNSRKRNMPILILEPDFIKWYTETPKNCCYCGVDEETLFKNKINRFDIERTDNNLPYKTDNIALACRLCNKVKSNILTAEEMLFIGKNVIIKKWKI